MLQLPLQGCQEFEAHPGRVGVHDSFCTYLFPAAGAAGAVSSQLKGTRGNECLSFFPAPCAGASLCAVGVMFPPGGDVPTWCRGGSGLAALPRLLGFTSLQFFSISLYLYLLTP